MKGHYFFAMILLFAGCSHRIQPGEELHLQSLLNQKNYFKLRSDLALLENQIRPEKKIYFRAFVENAFNQDKKSNQDIQCLFRQYSSDLGDSDKAALLRLEDKNYFNRYQYDSAALAEQQLIDHYSQVLDSSTLKEIRNELLIRNALSHTAAQELTQTSNTSLQWTRDLIGLMEIPIRCRDSVFMAIFDTQANISSISRTFAKRLGLKMLDVTYEEGSGITGIRFKTGMGIADSLIIGNIIIRHVVFQVMPDEILYLAPVKFSLNIILGLPLIEQLGEVHIFRDGHMFIPLGKTGSDLRNLALDGLDLVLSLRTDTEDTLNFYFDTGASGTDLYSTFFRRFKQKVLNSGKPDIAQNGGAGGVVKANVYILDSINLFIGDKKATLKQVNVLTEPIANKIEKFYGNIGQDFISQSKELILNFNEMYVAFN